VAPGERISLPLRWEFSPIELRNNPVIQWRWRAFTQTGHMVLESEQTFDTLTECMDDAKNHGYARPR
jgi:hypothetical protein